MHIQIQIQMSIGITQAVSPLCRGSSVLRCESQVGLGGPWTCHHLDSWSIWRFWIWWWYRSSDLLRYFTDWLACPFIKRQKYFFASLPSQDSHLKKRLCVNSLGLFLRSESLSVFASPCFRIYGDFVCGGSFQARCGNVCASLCRCICFLNILFGDHIMNPCAETKKMNSWINLVTVCCTKLDDLWTLGHLYQSSVCASPCWLSASPYFPNLDFHGKFGSFWQILSN